MTIAAWKLTSSPVDLAAPIGSIEGFLAANEASTGPYHHDDRFVAFLHIGGMEYDGGTTTDVRALRHETFHSRWARGLKPAASRTPGSTKPGPSITTSAPAGSSPSTPRTRPSP